ncbi:MAG: type II toxin-antitoxin system RelE/ParE family toxin [Methylophaga sp.]|nr:type II toxin-antitoxin system RelE/ParE family toxin [Methylophaga sp.]
MATFRLSSDAQTDLINIRHYTLKNWGSEHSKKYLSELQQTIELLSDSPEMGKKRTNVSIDTLSFPHASHVIYYVLQNDCLLVFAVLHKSMVPNNHLANRK